MQQQEIDEALEALPGKRWRWLFTPDSRWLNTVNTTSMRTVNAIRMFIGVTLLWAAIEIAVVWSALTRCGGWTALTLGEGESAAKVLLLCEESLATARLLDFAAALFESYGLILAAMAGIAVAEAIGKRATDTEHRERVEKAKKAPVIVPVPVTGERQAQAPVSQTVNVGEDAIAAAKPAPSEARPTQGMDDSRVDDERGS